MPSEASPGSSRLHRLQGVVQHYDWGGYDYIPNLIGADNRGRKPFAELWIGAHPKAPSMAAVGGQQVPLGALPGGNVPYLLKVLDARQMLSIQAHPSKAQAEEGFARENASYIQLDDARRNYRDDNHKPEVHVALTEFWMLHGFRPLEEISEVLRTVPELFAVMPSFDKKLAASRRYDIERRDLLRALYSGVMTMPQSSVDAILNPLIERLEEEKPAAKDSPDYWALRAAHEFPLPGEHRDRGIFSIYLLNLVHLRPGQGTYQPAGTLHAYLEGVNVELMANSDNVLRGGLTPKHVDTGELLRTLTFEAGKPNVIDGVRVADTEMAYPTEAAEFELSRIAVGTGLRHTTPWNHGPDVLIVVDGRGSARDAGAALDLKRGDILFAPEAVEYTIEGTGKGITLFRATAPV